MMGPTAPEIQAENLEKMYGDPVRDKHLDHVVHLNQSEANGSYCARNTAPKFRRNIWNIYTPIKRLYSGHVMHLNQSEKTI